LKPLTRLAQPTCPYVKPKLTDLYDIVLIELPEEPAIPPTGPELGSRNLVFPGSVANNGTIAATRKITNASVRHLPVRLTLANMAWVDLLENWLEVLPYPLISAQGDAILATANPASTHLPMIFKDGNSNYLPDMMYPANVLGASDDFRYAVGRGYRPLPEEEDANIIAPWIWDDAHGHATLPTTDELGAPFALVVSNDGNRVVGRHDFVSREIPGQGGAWDIGGNFGVYWNNRQAPQIIRGENGEYLGSPVACDANCDIIFGNVSWQRYDNHLRGQSNHSWYWNPETGRSGSLGALQPTEDNPEGWAYDLWAVSNSGSLAVGLYHSPEMTGQLPDGSKSYDGLIWSQNTGFVQLSELLAETGQNLDWPAVYAHDISPNGEYILLATAEIFTAPGQIGVPSFSRLALLRLTPKAQ
jgi:hypothetical protein